MRIERPEREMTDSQKRVADLYNKSSPKEQRAMDLSLLRVQASAVMASPWGIARMFPAFAGKTVKLKEPT